jgi:hypothetical protein
MSYLLAALFVLSLEIGLACLIWAGAETLRRREANRPLPPTRHMRVKRDWSA